MRKDSKSKIRNKPFNDVDIAVMCYDINQKYGEDIESHFGLRNIIDIQFDLTWEWFRMKFLFYFFGFFVPFTLQLFTVEAKYIYIVPLLILCLFTISVLEIGQMLKVRGIGRADYYSDKYNYVTDIHFLVFIFYFVQRIRFIENLLPSYYANDPMY